MRGKRRSGARLRAVCGTAGCQCVGLWGCGRVQVAHCPHTPTLPHSDASRHARPPVPHRVRRIAVPPRSVRPPDGRPALLPEVPEKGAWRGDGLRIMFRSLPRTKGDRRGDSTRATRSCPGGASTTARRWGRCASSWRSSPTPNGSTGWRRPAARAATITRCASCGACSSRRSSCATWTMESCLGEFVGNGAHRCLEEAAIKPVIRTRARRCAATWHGP